jgi:MFS family permease
LCLLLLVNILNFIDRLLPSVLVEAIRRDLHITDTQIGLIGGLAFAVIYSFASIAIARVADRWSPRWVIALSLGLWSFATAISGIARSFMQLFLARATVAAGEAGSTPAAHAIIHPNEDRW